MAAASSPAHTQKTKPCAFGMPQVDSPSAYHCKVCWRQLIEAVGFKFGLAYWPAASSNNWLIDIFIIF
jgi:hypothetical protein